VTLSDAWGFVKRRPPRDWGAFVMVLAVIAIAILLPVLRARESREIESVVARSGAVLIDAVQNPSIFDGEPADARAALEADSRQLSMLHDKLVLSHYYLAHSALAAALDYTDYNQRIGTKLMQVGAAEIAAKQALEEYEHSVALLKGSSLANRSGFQAAVNEAGPKARDATDLAYQECQLLAALTRQFGVAQTQALQHLSSLGPDVLAAVGSLRPAIVAASEKTLAQRKPFNPLSR
jgi:hypothetical protein